MIDRRWEQITAGAGFATVALLVGQLATWRNPHFNDPLTKITGYYVKNHGMALASIDIWMVGMIALLVFAAGLRSILRRSEGGADALSSIAFGGAVAMLGIGTVFNVTNGALGLIAGQASPGEIRLLMAVGNAADNFLFLPVGVFLGAASLAMVRERLSARWTRWLGIVGGLLLILGSSNVMDVNAPIGNLGMVGLVLFVIWAIAIGISLLRQPAVPAQAPVMQVRGERVPV